MLYRDIVKARLAGDKKRLTESSLSRVWQHVQNAEKKSVAILSAFRRVDAQGKPISKAENMKRADRLMSTLRSKGYGPTKLIGHWRECTDQSIDYAKCPEDKLVETKEVTFAVVGIGKDEAHKLGNEYDQDAIIYLGPETKGKATLIFRDGGDLVLGDFSAAKIAQGYSRVRGRPFVFEGFDMRPESYIDAITEWVLTGKKTMREAARLVLML